MYMNRIDADDSEDEFEFNHLQARYNECMADLDRCHRDLKTVGRKHQDNIEIYLEALSLTKENRINASH